MDSAQSPQHIAVKRLHADTQAVQPAFFVSLQPLCISRRRIALHGDLGSGRNFKRSIDMPEDLCKFLRLEQRWCAAAEVNADQLPLLLHAIIAADNVDLTADRLHQLRFFRVVPMVL